MARRGEVGSAEVARKRAQVMLTPSLPSLDSGGGFVYRSVAVVDCRLRGKPLRRDESGGAKGLFSGARNDDALLSNATGGVT